MTVEVHEDGFPMVEANGGQDHEVIDLVRNFAAALLDEPAYRRVKPPLAAAALLRQLLGREPSEAEVRRVCLEE